MPAKKKVAALPKFMKSKPTAKQIELIKEHSYDHLMAIVIDGNKLGPAGDYIYGYIEKLAEHDKLFGKIKPEMLTPHSLFKEAIR